MKTFILILFSTAYIQLGFAQNDLYAFNNPKSDFSINDTSKTNDEGVADLMATAHTKAAKKQINAFFALTLKYTEIMKDYCIEGESIVEVHLNQEGQILSADIIKSPHPSVSSLIKNTLSQYDSINVKNNDYQGDRVIEFNISFKLP